MNVPVYTHFEDACDVVMASDGTPIHSGKRDEWLEARRKLMTASDVAAILGLDPKRDALSVFISKRYPPKREAALTWHDARFWGLKLEQPIGQIVAEYLNWEFFPSGYLLQSKAHPLLGATLDAEVRPLNDNGRPRDKWRPYEGKNVGTWMADDWHPEDQTPPHRVLIQTQTQMMVTAAECVEAFALIGGNNPCPIQVGPHEPFRQVIIEKAEELFDRLKRDDPYPATEKSTEAIKEAFPGDDGSVIQLPREACRLVEMAAKLSRERSDLNEQEQAIRNEIKMMMKEATFGVLPEPVPIPRKKNGEEYDIPSRCVKWALSFRPPAWQDERESRSLLFIKDLPKIPKRQKVY